MDKGSNADSFLGAVAAAVVCLNCFQHLTFVLIRLSSSGCTIEFSFDIYLV